MQSKVRQPEQRPRYDGDITDQGRITLGAQERFQCSRLVSFTRVSFFKGSRKDVLLRLQEDGTLKSAIEISTSKLPSGQVIQLLSLLCNLSISVIKVQALVHIYDRISSFSSSIEVNQERYMSVFFNLQAVQFIEWGVEQMIMEKP
ncbi:hypothetical protein OIU74_002828 [Salix koriyanagi]|uniref:Uncharacterized protein n=1 Tax=Salix koriyanagi TaxID=2511006 RepID=A0A9Q0X5H0_9ROSI|nr:hypothetical protein OIU74_002828 [Salix koriyanagi]